MTGPSSFDSPNFGIPARVRRVAMPPIDALNTRMAEINAAGGDVISLGQSVPFFGPPPEMIDAVRDALDGFGARLHAYGPDAGIPELRHALSGKMREFNGLDFDADSQILVTPGSNQAFMVAMLTILENGDEVAIASPHYFNHHMAIELAGGAVKEIPLSEETGFRMRMEDVEAALSARTRAVVIVSPNNPTGAVYRADEIETITRELTSRGIYVISDDAYEVFCYDGTRHTNPAKFADFPERVITLGSLSKTFGMTGWRVGYVAASAEFVRQALKVQDAMAICAPIISQVAAVAALSRMPDYPLGMISELEQRREILQSTIERIPSLSWRKTDGALFGMIRADVEAGDVDLSWDALERGGVLTVPGAAFGRQWSGYLRISYGCSPRDRYEEALSRLEVFFSS